MDDLAQQEIHDILNHPDYDQSMLIEWFKWHYGLDWRLMWNRYQETGRI